MRCLHVIYFCLFNRKLQLNLTDCSDRIAAIHRLGCKCQPGVALQVHPSYFFYYQWEPICSGTPKKPHRFQWDNVTRLHTAVQQLAAPKNKLMGVGWAGGWLALSRAGGKAPSRLSGCSRSSFRAPCASQKCSQGQNAAFLRLRKVLWQRVEQEILNPAGCSLSERLKNRQMSTSLSGAALDTKCEVIF